MTQQTSGVRDCEEVAEDQATQQISTIGVFASSGGGRHKRVTVSECGLKALRRHTAR